MLPRKKVKSQSYLKNKVCGAGTIRVGSTAHPKSRQASFQSAGYSGTMTLARTSNMKALI